MQRYATHSIASYGTSTLLHLFYSFSLSRVGLLTLQVVVLASIAHVLDLSSPNTPS